MYSKYTRIAGRLLDRINTPLDKNGFVQIVDVVQGIVLGHDRVQLDAFDHIITVTVKLIRLIATPHV